LLGVKKIAPTSLTAFSSPKSYVIRLVNSILRKNRAIKETIQNPTKARIFCIYGSNSWGIDMSNNRGFPLYKTETSGETKNSSDLWG